MRHFLFSPRRCVPPDTVPSPEDDGLIEFKTYGFESRVFERLVFFSSALIYKLTFLIRMSWVKLVGGDLTERS